MTDGTQASSPFCKCCGETTSLFARYDFSRTCEDDNAPVFAPSGISVPYYRCSGCGFVFTPFFDGWSQHDMAERIYNADYALVDPDFDLKRPEFTAGELEKMLRPVKATISLLDYGGGKARLVQELEGRGFANCQSFDPYFSPDISNGRPEGRFDLVTAFEVVEHAIHPYPTFQDALSYIAPGGALLFSTSLQSRRADPDWWYIAPRNGHVSIHSHDSLKQIAKKLGVRYLALNDHLHLFFRTPQSPVAHQIATGQRSTALYAASKRGLRSFAGTASLFGQLGFAMNSRDIRHTARAILTSSGLG